MYASAGGHEGIVRVLIEAGADVNLKGMWGTALETVSSLFVSARLWRMRSLLRKIRLAIPYALTRQDASLD